MPTRPGRAAVVAVSAATAAIGLGQLLQAFQGHGDYVSVLDLVAGVAGLVAAWCLVRTGCFEARLASALLAWCAALGTVLALSLGSPGRGPRQVELWDAAVLVLALLVLVLLHGRAQGLRHR